MWWSWFTDLRYGYDFEDDIDCVYDVYADDQLV